MAPRPLAGSGTTPAIVVSGTIMKCDSSDGCSLEQSGRHEKIGQHKQALGHQRNAQRRGHHALVAAIDRASR